MPRKKKIKNSQKVALECYLAAVGPLFSKGILARIKQDIAKAEYQDEYVVLRGYMVAKAESELAKRIERFFKKLLDEVIG